MITLENISFSYGKDTRLFSGLSLEIKPGSIHGLMGKNGAGKTTLLKIISGLRKQGSGNCNVDGHTPFNRETAFLKNVFLVPEEIPSPDYTIRNYIKRYTPFYESFSVDTMQRYLADFDLEPKMHLGNLSYGQRKKFFLAFAMAAGTKLILFDEPTNGLDVPSKSIFRKLAASAINEGRTFIISTHQVRDLNMLIDNVIFLDRGNIRLNRNIQALAESYSFVTLTRQDLEDRQVLYSEQHLDGIRAIMPNKTGYETQVDLELLFNAVVFDKISIPQTV